MPELPEVEITRRGLAAHPTGQVIADAVIRNARLRCAHQANQAGATLQFLLRKLPKMKPGYHSIRGTVGKTTLPEENMKYILLSVILLLSACDGSSPTAPKIAEPQREALEKAKGVEQMLQQQNEESQKRMSEAEGK